ncbi:MAG: hypothetical protein JSV21_10800 [Nitrospirota bacterium]|nr:MAG: hypothetical protein JSV21_10800 [Nitrospirota bacterium]
MAKKIAVVVRERQREALRMAVGITLLDDVINMFIMDRPVEPSDENDLNLETAEMMDINVYTNVKDGGTGEYLSDTEIADKLLDYDHIIPY